jgi:hypothetical protein
MARQNIAGKEEREKRERKERSIINDEQRNWNFRSELI